MRIEAQRPIVWRVSLRASPAQAWPLLDTDAGRQRHWALKSEPTPGGFRLTFPGAIQGVVQVLERRPERLLRILYFGSTCTLELEPDGEGTLFTATDDCSDLADWADRHAGWVSWLLIFKAAADHQIDLRGHRPDRHWFGRFADP
ncbi:MAG: hypothetical protein M3M95_02995 [Pseudomonadota bacterium]|nr:hypothetical protein [Pseudomonadota bacterium]